MVLLGWFPRRTSDTESLRGSCGAATSLFLLSTREQRPNNSSVRHHPVLILGVLEMHESRLCVFAGKIDQQIGSYDPCDRGMYQLPGAAITRNHKLGALTQQKFIFRQFWELEAPHLGVSRAVLSKALESPSHLFPASSVAWVSLVFLVCRCPPPPPAPISASVTCGSR